MITLTLVDDEPFVRHALRMLLTLEPDLSIVGEAADGEAAISLVESMHPDVVLMDVTMPEMDGIAATARLKGTAPESAVIILSLKDDAATRRRAKCAGAAGFIGKHETMDKLLAAIRAVAPREQPA